MIFKIALYLVLIYCSYLVLVFLLQRHILFPGQHFNVSTIPSYKSPHYESIWLQTSAGDVEAWFMPAKNVSNDIPRPIIIFGHGNGELIDHWPHFLSPYNSFGLHILLVEFPGYGRSQGTPSQNSIKETFIKAYDWVIAKKGVDRQNIIAHGRSVGGGAACLLAIERSVKALILQSTFTNIKQFAIQFLAPSFLIRDPFDNLPIVKTFEGPILIIHGKYDEVIPYRNGVTLAKEAKNAQLITYNCHHNDCPSDWDMYWMDIKTFLEKNDII